jgi:microcystin synthetase protein McyA
LPLGALAEGILQPRFGARDAPYRQTGHAGLTGVPNARLWPDISAVQTLQQSAAETPTSEVRKIVQRTSTAHAAVDPEDLWALERELPYRVEIRSSQDQVNGCCDAVLRRVNAGSHIQSTQHRYPARAREYRPLASYANNPLRQRIAAKLIPQLRLSLSTKLPEYMVPHAFVLLEAMPLTANGKIDRKALPVVEQWRPEGSTTYTAPRSQTEEMVATIMADVLRVEQVSAEDNFFELGGHSLSTTQIVARSAPRLASSFQSVLCLKLPLLLR